MTERLHPPITHIATLSQATAPNPKSTPTLLTHLSSKVETVDEEPYTIKCICDFTDDDGNTIYCDACDTWQHIECYYPHNVQDCNRDDFAHSCADCKPRPLDRPRAIEHQKFRRMKIDAEEELAERKSTKRPPSKSHKKKTKPSDLQLNGHTPVEPTAKHSGEHPPAHGHKKSKSTHRPSQSISSTAAAKRSPSYTQKSGNPHGHPPSPATTPPDLPTDLEIHNYSDGFLSLYNDDREVQTVQTNSFVSLDISNAMSLWLRDHDKLRTDTGLEYDEVFQTLPSNIDSVMRTPVVEHKKRPVAPDTVVHWRYLTAPQSIEKDVPLAELNGQIGIQKGYCEDPTNRWADLSSPLPFVFFHPMLPLYIDTRSEGSLARYVRRSCRPNAILDTYIAGGSEYQFWLMSDRRIAANEQITIPWDFRLAKPHKHIFLQLLGLHYEGTTGQPDYDPGQMDLYQQISSWIYQILSEYGGCACDLGPECAFARFHRKYVTRSQSKSNKKKSRKPKIHAISPTSTSQATNSRAPSEGHGDDGGDNDSGSSRSKPPSRDMTPNRQGSFDTLGILTEPTDRDKRKVAMVEDSFRRMEQQQQPPRKKKRTSDGTGASTTSKPKPKDSPVLTPVLPNGTSERRYKDAGTNRSMSGSPHGLTTPYLTNPLHKPASRHGSAPIPSRHSSAGPSPEYKDASVQTDSLDGEWFSLARQTPRVKKRIVSLSKRLLENRYRSRADTEERRRLSCVSPSSVASTMNKMGLDSPSSEGQLVSPIAGREQVPAPVDNLDPSQDSVMTDALPLSSEDIKAPTPTSVMDTATGSKLKSPELRVQLPPVPAFNSTTSAIPSVTTPLSAGANMVQSPFAANGLPSPFGAAAVNGMNANPSPVKKKLSLSDYTRRNKAAAAKPVGGSLKAPAGAPDEAKSPTTSDVIMTDSPTTEKVTEA